MYKGAQWLRYMVYLARRTNSSSRSGGSSLKRILLLEHITIPGREGDVAESRVTFRATSLITLHRPEWNKEYVTQSLGFEVQPTERIYILTRFETVRTEAHMPNAQPKRREAWS